MSQRILLIQLDGKIPNIALMRIAAHHAAAGDTVELRIGATFYRRFWDKGPWGKVYASLIFERSQMLARNVLAIYPEALIGGTGWNVASSLEAIGIETLEQDYSLYPRFQSSIGFTQRGCRLKCPFCVVPRKEGAMRQEKTIEQIWRGDPHPRELLLLDNDFFGQPAWRDRIAEIKAGQFKVSFNQGINARFLTDEAAAAIASIDYRDDQMRDKRIYTAWDNRGDEARLFEGLERLVKYGVNPRQIMVYMLIGYWPGETEQDRDYRRARLREFGCLPFPMPYTRSRELVGFQTWVVGAYDKRVPWHKWKAANYSPRNLQRQDTGQGMLAL